MGMGMRMDELGDQGQRVRKMGFMVDLLDREVGWGWGWGWMMMGGTGWYRTEKRGIKNGSNGADLGGYRYITNDVVVIVPHLLMILV
jgi:hypothetical protein